MTKANEWLRIELAIGAWIAAAVPFLQITAAGADGPLIGVAAALSNCVAGGVLVLVARPSPAMLVRMLVPLGLLCGGLLWAVWPDLTLADPSTARIAADLVPTEAARWMGEICLLCGTVALGYRRALLRTCLEALCIMAALNLALGLVLRQIDPHSVWGIHKGILAGRFTGTMLNANAMGTVYGAVAVIALGCFFGLQRGGMMSRGSPRLTKALYLLLATAAVVATELTGSRTAFLTTLFSVVVLLGVNFFRSMRARSIPLIWAGIGTTILILFAGGATSVERLPNLGHDAIRRIEMWQHFAGLAQNAGPHGYGLGSFSQINTLALPNTGLATDLWYVNAAHNIFLQMVIEGGFPFALLWSLGIAYIAISVAARPPQSGSARIMMLAVVGALMILLIGGSIDVALNVPGVRSLAISLLGLSWGRAIRNGGQLTLAPPSGHTRPAIAASIGVPAVNM